MHRIFATCLETGIASVVLIPLFWLLHRRYFQNTARTACCLVLSLYLAAVDAVVGLPCLLYVRFDTNVNLVPFAYMFSDYRSSLLNVLLFLPLGLLLPMLWKPFLSFFRTALLGLLFSLAIELLQLFTRRATDINDLMTNTLGTILGWCVGRLVLKLFPRIVPGEDLRELAVVFGVSFGVMFFIQPFFAELVWRFLR